MNMKKSIFVLVSVILASGSAFAAYTDGVHHGVGQGNGGPIEVDVTVKGGKITAVTVTKNSETPMIYEAAQASILPAIVEKNGTQGVEAVSGASHSSKGIIDAVNNALTGK
jgi:uncharacterized protein with FMN-binding domain